MTGRLIITAIAVMLILFATASAYDEEYHTNDEIYDEIVAWQDSLPDWCRVDTIGYSQLDSLPIWAVKLSNNVNSDEDRPTVLFVGQVHAEELIGVEITLALIDDLLTHHQQITPYLLWFMGLEMWIIPTLNPEGHAVVMDSLDLSFRKNKSDCNNNGIFDFDTTGIGNDIDGVDLNRNFPLNWVHGDSFMQPANEPFDYFRGFSPLSESESQALWAFGEQEKFSFSIVWHSSRTTNFSEKLFYPWEWNELKHPPDFETIDILGWEIANNIPKYGTGGFYQAIPTYQGTIAYLIEAGPSIQSPWSTAEQVIEANLEGAYILLHRAAGTGDVEPRSQLTGLVTDVVNGHPLTAEVKIVQLHNAFLQPRTCEPTYGRYRRYLMPGTYEVEARMRGYYPQTTQLTVNASMPREQDFALAPKPVHYFHGEIRELGGDPLACTLYIHGEDVLDTLNVSADGQYSCHLPEGDYELVFDSPGHVVRFDAISLTQSRYVEFELSPGVSIFSDDFESGIGQWTADGTNLMLVRWDTEAADSLWNGGMVATESPYDDYLPEVENWIVLTDPLDLTDRATASLRFQHWYYFEPGGDSCQVEASTDGGSSWDVIAGPYWGQDIGWGAGYASLDPYCGMDNVLLRWKIETDESLEEQGWRIDDVEIFVADTAVYVEPVEDLPREYALYSVYPNPFNSQLSIRLDLPREEAMDITLWDIAGRKVAEIHEGALSAGQHCLGWKASPERPSGIYLLKISGESKQDIRKVLYLK